MNIEQTIEDFNQIRDQIYNIARENHGAVMEGYAWLRHALNEYDINLDFTADGRIHAYGRTYTMQTLDHEFWEFWIDPQDVLDRLK